MGKFFQIIFRFTRENSEEMHQNYFLFSLMMFKCSIGVLPSPVSAPFQYNSVIHTHNTRRSKFIHTPIGRSEATYRTFYYRGAHIWNYISQNVPQMFLAPVLKI